MKKRIVVMLVSCMLLGQVCPFTISAEQIEQNTITTDAVGAEEEVLISGDCSADAYDHVEWRVIRTPEEGKLKLIISGTGKMKDYSYRDSFDREITLELSDLGIVDSLSEVEICEGVLNVGDCAFCESKIEKVSLPEGFLTIGSEAFEDCKNLSVINLPESVEEIEYAAFSQCQRLESVVFPAHLKRVGYSAFAGSGLINVRLPENTDMGYCVFSGCEQLKEVVVQEKSDITVNMFYDCPNLENICFPENWTGNIDSEAFEDCKKLTEIVFPKNWTGNIRGGAFNNCSNLESVVMPEKMTGEIGGAFWNCTKLKELSIPNGIKEVHRDIWSGCSQLEVLRLPKSLTHVDGLTEENNSGLKDVYYEGTKARWDIIYSPTENDLKMGKDITIHCKDGDFTGPSPTPWPDGIILSGEFSDTVKWELMKASEEGKLKLVITGAGSIPGFYSTGGVLSRYIEKYWESISEVEIAEGIQEIGGYAFFKTNIEKVVLPNSLGRIENGSFEGCEQLKNIELPSNLTYIGANAFEDCKQLKSIEFPPNLSCLGGGAFAGSGLTSVTLPEKIPFLTGIEREQFAYCKELKKVIILPKTLDLGWFMFSGCTSLEEVVFPDRWNGKFHGCAFSECENLKELDFPEGIEYLTSSEWTGCKNLKVLRLPHSLKQVYIYDEDNGNDSLSNVYYNGTLEEWDKIFYPSEEYKKLISEGKITIHCSDGVVLDKNTIAMQRLYNPYSREHFYTNSTHERDVLVSRGWKYEGIGWYAPAKSKTPVYRLYNAFVNDHHYTTSSYEREVLIKKYGWIDEGIGWYSDDDKSVPLYRRYCPFLKSGAHHYTPALNEAKHLLTVGWKDEGVAWYGVDPEKK
uniref:leucine-rich repeat protein n=1 Tax=Eubacterium cellulosolvens TaxID=29322 RepID=UPI0009DF783A|nr:leucine-rich repeat protein [[Eubacterium] cellulosolvens]